MIVLFNRLPARKPRAARPRARSGFSLVELLVVLAVISVLTSLLLPALGSGKHSAQRIRCVNNLRQLSLASQMYWDDNSGAAFRYRGISTNGGDIYWFGWLGQGAEGDRVFDPTPGALFPYLGKGGVTLCPALQYSLQEFKLKATGAAYGYGYNLRLSVPLTQAAIPISRVARPTEIALFADAAQVNTFQAPASPANPMLEEFYYIDVGEATAHFRHRKLAEVAFCDGHVRPAFPAPGTLDLRLPDQVIGQLASDNLVFP